MLRPAPPCPKPLRIPTRASPSQLPEKGCHIPQESFVCMYLSCMHACVHVCMYLCMYVCYICIQTHAQTYNICTCMFVSFVCTPYTHVNKTSQGTHHNPLRKFLTMKIKYSAAQARGGIIPNIISVQCSEGLKHTPRSMNVQIISCTRNACKHSF
jgi:hypothetical protein